jgi:hypothetical protein
MSELDLVVRGAQVAGADADAVLLDPAGSWTVARDGRVTGPPSGRVLRRG